MGYFTWKDCQDRRKSVGYDNKAYVICPDDTVLEESCYCGYGIFAGEDIYELVVDWNRSFLKEIFDQKTLDHPGKFYFGQDLYPVAIAAMESDEKALQTLRGLRAKNPDKCYCGDREWKRSIGIAIACEDEDNESLPCPIKISATKPRKPYAKLKASRSTQ